MSLFPAYGLDAPAGGEQSIEPVPRWETAGESELLASSDSDAEPPPAPASEPEAAAAAPQEGDYYEDRRFDGGNLRVSTIYYPGRPQYMSEESSRAIGLRGLPRAGRKRARRYWERPAAGDAGAGEAEREGERAAALRRALRARPHDERLWLQYVDYQEWAGGAAAAAAAAAEAAERLPRAAALRGRRLRALRATLAPRDYLAALRDLLAQEKEPEARGALWARLVAALGAGAAGEGARAARDAAAAAARELRRLPAAYPRLVAEYGLVLRAGGLWETLVLLLELLLAMHCGPRAPLVADDAAERRLQDYEDKALASGLPSEAVWARVERARGAAHWRPAADAPADPQRAPEPAELADLLLPLAEPAALQLLAVNVLRLAKVPLLPAAEYAQAAAGGAGAGERADGGEALLPLLRAARRLPRAPRAAAARRLVQLAVDPPHYFSDDYGFRGWVESLWDGALQWAGGAGGAEGAGVALLCWRLRWLHALLLLVDDDAAGVAEADRLRGAARAALRRWGGAHAVPFALFARLAPPAAARRVALAALTAALRDPATPHHHLLFVARVVQEVCPAAEGAEGAWALAGAALRRAPPADMRAPPPPTLLHEALAHCERRCMELEAEMAAAPAETRELGDGAALRAALLPGAAEWAVARAMLAPPARRAQLLRELLEADAGSGPLLRWREQQAAALARLAPGGAAAARALAPRYPGNALLALMAGEAALWAPGAGAAPGEPSPRGTRALAAAWPALLRAVAADWEPEAAGVAARVLRRLTARGGGALLWALRLEAEARAPRPRLERAAYAALDALPGHKWLAVRCGALGAGGAGAADVLLERGLRLHALPDELLPHDQ